MRKLFIISIILFISGILLAQNGKKITIDELRTPNVPGFVLLGVEPKSIDKATTPYGLAASIFSSATNLGLKPNYALEFSPYWLINHPNLTFDDYYKNDDPINNFLRTTSISIATAETKFNNNFTGTGIGLGFNSQLFSGKMSDELLSTQQKYLAELNTIQGRAILISVLLNRLKFSDSKTVLKDSIEIAINELSNRPDFKNAINLSKSEIIVILDEIKKDLIKSFEERSFANQKELEVYLSDYIKNSIIETDKARALRQKIQDLNKTKIGFIWNVSGAVVFSFKENKYSSSYLTHSGLWTTIGYSIKNVDFLVLGRYIFNSPVVIDTISNFTNNYDLGASLTYQRKNFNVSAELIRRFSNKVIDQKFSDGYTYKTTKSQEMTRYSINFQYKINDLVTICTTLGKNFNSTQNGDDLICVFGINYGFSGTNELKIK
jgi:hypothetical protein